MLFRKTFFLLQPFLPGLDIWTGCSSITCVCDPQGTIFNCFPTNYKLRNDISDSSPAGNIEKYQMEQDEKGRDQSME